MSEKDILKQLERKPNEALAEILKKYGGLLNGIAYGILGNSQDAEECIADALLKLWQKHEQIRNPKQLKSYLCAITRNTALDCLRKKKPLQELPLQQELLEDYPTSRQMDDWELGQVITDAIHQLGDPSKTIFLKRYYAQHSIQEIAEEMNLTERAVESHLYRGRKQLKSILSEGVESYET